MRITAIIALCLLASSVFGADVSTPEAIGYATDDGGYLGIGRTRAGLHGDTLVFFPSKAGPGQTGWLVSYDRGATWTNVTNGQPDGDNWCDDHSGMWLEGGLHMTIRDRDDPVKYTYIAPPYLEANREALKYISDGNFYANVVATAPDDVWIIDHTNDNASTVMAWHTTDRFVSDTTMDTIWRPQTSTTPLGSSSRINAILDTAGYPSVLCFLMTPNGGVTPRFTDIHYNGSTWDSTDVFVDAGLGANDRSYDHTFVNGKLHMVFFDVSTHIMVHVWDTGDGFDSTRITGDIGYTQANPALSVYNDGERARLYCMYGVPDANTGVSFSWTEADGWGDSTVITGASHHPVFIAVPRYVPLTYDVIPASYRDQPNDSCYYVEVEAAPAGGAGYHVIRSLPYTFDDADHSGGEWDTLVMAGDLSSTGDGITIEAGYHDTLLNVLCDLGGHTLTYGTGNGNGATGIAFGEDQNLGLLQNIIVQNGSVIHGATDTSVSGCVAVQMQGSYITVQDLANVTVRGYDGHLFNGGGLGDYMWDIIDCKGTSYVTAYTSRATYDGSAIILEGFRSSDIAGDTSLYHVKVEGCRVYNSPNQAFHFGGYEAAGNYVRALMYYDTGTCDARNDFYPIDSDGGGYNGTYNSFSNSYVAHYRFADEGSEIRGCLFTSDSNYYGAQGLFFDNDNTDATRPIRIVNTTIDICNGPNGEYTDQEGVGLRLRYDPHILVDSCTIRVRVDGTYGTTFRSYHGIAVRITDRTAGGFVRITNSTLSAIALDDSSRTMCEAFSLDDCRADSIYSINNNLTSSGTIYQFGGFNGGGTGLTAIGDTVQIGGVPLSNGATFYLGYNSNEWSCLNNYARDLYYGTGTADDDVVISTDPLGAFEITTQRTLTVLVNGSTNDLPVVGAYVNVLNNYGQEVLTGYSDSGGVVSGVVSYGYYGDPYSDSTAFNDFSVQATVSPLRADSTMTVSWEAAGGTITLDLAMEGTGEWGGSGDPPIEPAEPYEYYYDGDITFEGDVTLQ